MLQEVTDRIYVHQTIMLSDVTLTIVDVTMSHQSHLSEIKYQKLPKKDIWIIIPFHPNLMYNPIPVCIGG